MTLRTTLAGVVLCIGCAWPGVLLAQAHPAFPEWMPRNAPVSSSIALRSPAYALPRAHRISLTPADRWWAQDKAKHVAFSFLWTLSAQYVLVDKAGWSNRAALPVAAGSSAAVGLSKEVFDWTIGPTRRFSTRDLVADAVGIALAVGVIVL